MALPAVHSKPFARASLLLIGLAWTLPFLQPYHRFPLTAFYSEALAFGIGLAAALLLVSRQSWREAELPVVALVPPALALLMGLQVALGRVPYPEQAVTATFYLLWASLLMLLARVLVRELGMAAIATTLARFLLAGGLLSALAAFAQHYHVVPALDFLVAQKVSARVYGNLGQSNHYAAYLTMALCSAAYLYGSARLRVAWALACAALLLPALALSGSRSPWIYIGMLAILALLLFRARREDASRQLLIYSLCLIPGFVIAGLIVSQWGASATSAVAGTGEQVTSAQRLFEAATGANPRVQLAIEAWEMFLSQPVLGAGWGQFAWHHFIYIGQTSAVAAPGVYNHAHNIVLHLLAECGAVGGLLLAGGVLAWIADLRKIKLDLEWWWVIALLGMLGIHSMMENPLWYSYFLGMTAVLLGLGAQRMVLLRLSGIARLTVAMLMLVGWFNLVSVLPYYREFERLVFIPAKRGATQPNEQTFVEAIARVHREPLLTPYVELAVAYGATVSEEKLREKLALTDRAMRFAPTSVVVYRHALLLALAGETTAAMRQLERAMRAYPEDIKDIVAELATLARRHPDAFQPLLDLATSRLRR